MKDLRNRFAKVLYVAFALMLTGCVDDLFVSGSENNDGPATLTLNVAYNPIAEGLSATTRGVDANLDFELRDITVVLYAADDATKEAAGITDGKPLVYRYFNGQDYQTKQEERYQTTTEHHTRHAAMSIKDIAPGNYRIFALANVDGLLSVEDIKNKTEEELRKYTIRWDYEFEGESGKKNPRTYNIPDAMFGYFHKADMAKSHEDEYKAEEGTYIQDVIYHNTNGTDNWNCDFTNDLSFNADSRNGLYYDAGKNNKREFNLTAPTITVSGSTTVHAWLKRTISRLTVGYDGSGLNRGVEIYVKSVHVRDAVTTCLLGEDNVAVSEAELIRDDDDERLNIVYSPEAGATGANDAITNTTPAYPRQNNDDQTKSGTGWNQSWYDYVHGSTKAYGSDNDDPRTLDPAAPENYPTPETLYFMENIQGKVTDYTKEDFETGKFPKSYREDWASGSASDKDGKPYGTYIEVEAYYRNTNKPQAKEGNIKYRFMLGQNVTDDFNAERNRHYKLTLSFIGDANDVDWHIEYEDEREEGYYFRIPYDQDYDIDDQGFRDEENDETWYKNENWKQSNVWYAYYTKDDGETIPIAEIVKEIIYTDTQGYTTTVTSSDMSNFNERRKFYQVVTLYPITKVNNSYQTDYSKGLIAQVLDCDYINFDGNLPKANGTISMNPRTARNKAITGATGGRGYYVINSLSWGTDTDEQTYNYVTVTIENDGQFAFTLTNTPLSKKLPTAAYKIADADDNYYPIVKIGTSYWIRENLHTKNYSTSFPKQTKFPEITNDIVERGQMISQLKQNEDYGPGDNVSGYVSYGERFPLYMEHPSGDGYIYNYFAFSGTPPTTDDGNKYTYGKEIDDITDPFQGSMIDGDPESTNGATLKHLWLGQEGEDNSAQNKRNQQLAPHGWHLPQSHAVYSNFSAFLDFWGEKMPDTEYIEEYVGNNWGRLIKEITDIPSTYNLSKYNLSNFSLTILPQEKYNITSTNSNTSSVDFSLTDDTPTELSSGMVFPYWSNLLVQSKVIKVTQNGGYYSYNPADGTKSYGVVYAEPPILIKSNTYNGQIIAHRDMSSWNLNNPYELKNAQYFESVTHNLYLPVRCVRHANNSDVPLWTDVKDKDWYIPAYE